MIIPYLLEYQSVMSSTPASPAVCAMESFYLRDTKSGADLNRLHPDKGRFLDKSDREVYGTDKKKYFSKLVSRTKLKLCEKKQQNIIQKKILTCHQCKYTTDRKNNLKRHIVTMHQNCNKVLECCGVLFDSKSSLKEHVSMFHSSGYQCQVCGRNFCRKALLRRHLSVHSGQKDYKCPLCSYATSHKSNLERHQKVHEKKCSNSDGLHFNTSDGSLNKTVRFAKKTFEETKYLTKYKSFSKKFDIKERKNNCKDRTSFRRRSLKLKDSKTQSEGELYTGNGIPNKSFSESSTTENNSEMNLKHIHTDKDETLVGSNSFFTFKDINKSTENCHERIPKNENIHNLKSKTQNLKSENNLKQNKKHSSLISNSYIFHYNSGLEEGSPKDTDSDKIPDQNLLDENSNFPTMNVTTKEKRNFTNSYKTDNMVLKSRLCTSPYKCQVCCDTFTSQFEFLSHCCDNVNQKTFLLPVTCMVMKKSQVR